MIPHQKCCHMVKMLYIKCTDILVFILIHKPRFHKSIKNAVYEQTYYDEIGYLTASWKQETGGKVYLCCCALIEKRNLYYIKIDIISKSV